MRSNNPNYNRPGDRYAQMSSFQGSPFEQTQRQVFGNEPLIISPFERALQQIFGGSLLRGTPEERAQRAFRGQTSVSHFTPHVIGSQNINRIDQTVAQIAQNRFHPTAGIPSTHDLQ